MNKYSLIQIGDTAEIKHTITQEDINKFVDLTGDDNKLHVDEVYASKTSFKKPVAHGILGASFISTIIGTKLPGDGALWYAQNLEFLQPVRIGDELKIIAKVIKKIERTKTIELQTDIFNQHKQKVTTGFAKVKIVEFSDYECSYCARNVATMNKIKEEYKDQVSITFRDYPLEFHKDAKNAALASQCAFEQDNFWEYHDELFRNQDALDKESLKKYAKELKLDTKIFDKCLDDKKYAEEVENDLKDGAEAGVTGTPATFINGRRVVGAQPYEVFKEIIDEELAK